jgi:hypothetical protein
VIAEAGKIRLREGRRLDGLEGPIDARHLVVCAPEGSHDEQVLFRVWEHDPLAAPRADERAGGEGHRPARGPKVLGFAARMAVQSALAGKRSTV